MNWSDFFNMGGYGFFVWASWGLTLLVLMLNIVLPGLKNRSIKNSIKRDLRRKNINSPEQTKSSKQVKNSKK